jgi:hypothetical protein
MNDIRFDTQENEFGAPTQASQGFDLSGKLISWGLVSDRKQAEYVLIFVAIGALVLSYVAYKALTGGGDAPPLLPQ